MASFHNDDHKREVALPKAPTNHASLALALVRNAGARGVVLSYPKAKAAVRGVEILKRQQFKLTVTGLHELPSHLRPAVRWVCAALYEVKGIDPRQYLAELDRLDAKDALDTIARWRANRVPTIRPSRSPLLSESAWIEAFGIC
jgi:hypothetical protein